MSHSARKGTALIAMVAPDVLDADRGEVRSRVAAGERLLGR